MKKPLIFLIVKPGKFTSKIKNPISF